MEKHNAEHAGHGRARRWAREIVLAVLLTVAAVAFIAAAVVRSPLNIAPQFETARKPSGN
jgi:hypothetical protein